MIETGGMNTTSTQRNADVGRCLDMYLFNPQKERRKVYNKAAAFMGGNSFKVFLIYT